MWPIRSYWFRIAQIMDFAFRPSVFILIIFALVIDLSLDIEFSPPSLVFSAVLAAQCKNGKSINIDFCNILTTDGKNEHYETAIVQ